LEAKGKIKVLVADASSYVRLVISDILSTEQDMQVVDTAQDGEDMLGKVRLHQPDVVILDVEIPKSARLSILKRIKQQSAAAVVLLGKEDKFKETLILDSIQKTACQIVIKPEGLLPQMRAVADELIAKVKIAAQNTDPNSQLLEEDTETVTEPEEINGNSTIENLRLRHKLQNTGKVPSHLVVLGASTGGAQAIEYILRRLPADFSGAVLIAQHMPPGFSTTFTRRLNSICELPVEEATSGARIEGGRVIVATGDANLEVKKMMGSKTNLCVDFSYDDYSLYDRPSVDLLMQSAAMLYEDKAVGIILSGLGKDGSVGLSYIHNKGGYTLAQDQDSSAIFGMAKSAIEEGVINKVLPLSEIPRYLIHHIRHTEKML
jgi:two-component system chemotaxis response regulator CheB